LTYDYIGLRLIYLNRRWTLGFEILYEFYERSENSDYDLTSLKEMKRRVGDMYEDTSLEQLAIQVMKQLSRRDILVKNVHIYEFAKKKISFKETNGGILIKNKKFVLDQTGIKVIEEEEIKDVPLNDLVVPSPVAKPPRQSTSIQTPSRYEIFDANASYLQFLANKGIKMTPKKRYPIVGEETAVQRINVEGMVQELPGINYSTIDDEGKQVKISSVNFEPEQRGLTFGNLINQVQNDVNGRPKLLYQGGGDMNMPDIRRGNY
jgi:hypothetical protein